MKPALLGILACILAFGSDATAQIDSWQAVRTRLNASKISSRSSWRLRSMMPRLGLPTLAANASSAMNVLCREDLGEVVMMKDKAWLSRNPETDIVNWMCWDLDVMAPAAEKDRFRPVVDAKKWSVPQALWDSIVDQAYSWGLEAPMGETTVVAGSLLGKEALSLGKEAVPYAYYMVICKKVKGGLGWKSIGFVVPNSPEAASTALWGHSCSVNLVEYKSGWNFFPNLPASVQEKIEEITAYELFCPLIEVDEDMAETPDDWREAPDNDVMEDILFEMGQIR